MNVIESALHILLHTLLSHMWGRLQLECPTSYHETPEVTGQLAWYQSTVYYSGENDASTGGVLEYWWGQPLGCRQCLQRKEMAIKSLT